MATKKKAPKKSRAKAAKPKAKPAVQAKAAVSVEKSNTQSMVLVGNVQGKIAAPTDKQRKAFRSRPADAACQDLGEDTRAVEVLSETARWLPIIFKEVSRGSSVLHYGAPRLAYLCELLVELDGAINVAQATHTSRAGAVLPAVAARAAARVTRTDLAEKLDGLAHGDDADEAAVSLARQPYESDGDLGRALTNLASLADTWIGRAEGDEGLTTLVEEVSLTSADVDKARAAATTLANATAAKTEAGDARMSDPAPVNLVEGRVLFEARRAYNQFKAAHAKDGTIPALVPGPMLRRVIGSRAKASEVTDPAAPAVTTTTNGAASTSA